MNNIITSLSFSIYSNKGVYALLLGSGVSKPSGIPTGWDIVIDLIRKIAKLKNEECTPDPENWFKNKYSEEPDYSNILSKLVATPSERINLLKPYFEPSHSDIEQGLKLPTQAHQLITQLVKKGYFKIILTTNFDRLIENALQSIGVEPTVVRHPNDIDGIMPLVHNNITIIKVNGDYLDSRFLNTKIELANYNRKMTNFLVQIINDFGILSCGWSAKWDIALVNTLRQCHNFRFGSYWTYKEKCEAELKDIATYRKGEIVKISDADSFFRELSENIEALENINDNHPLSIDIAVARLKKLIVKDESKILLYDLVLGEQEKAIERIKTIDDFSLYPDNTHLAPQLNKYESALNVLIPLVVNGVYWCKPEHYKSFENIILRAAEPPKDPQTKFYQDSKSLHYYPALLLLTSLGISAIYTQKFDLLNKCFNLKISQSSHNPIAEFNLIEIVHCELVEPNHMKTILATNNGTPLSNYIKQKLRPFFTDLITQDLEYENYFDLFEYILSLSYVCLRIEHRDLDWAPIGSYVWNSYSGRRKNSSLILDFISQAESQDKYFLPLKSGMFGGSIEKFLEAKKRLDTLIHRNYW